MQYCILEGSTSPRSNTTRLLGDRVCPLMVGAGLLFLSLGQSAPVALGRSHADSFAYFPWYSELRGFHYGLFQIPSIVHDRRPTGVWTGVCDTGVWNAEALLSIFLATTFFQEHHLILVGSVSSVPSSWPWVSSPRIALISAVCKNLMEIPV